MYLLGKSRKYLSVSVYVNLLTLMIAIRGFPKIDHCGIDARIVLDQIEFSKNVTPYRDRTPGT